MWLFRGAFVAVAAGTIAVCRQRAWGLLPLALGAIAMAVDAGIEIVAASGACPVHHLVGSAAYHLGLPDFQDAAAAALLLAIGVAALARQLYRALPAD